MKQNLRMVAVVVGAVVLAGALLAQGGRGNGMGNGNGRGGNGGGPCMACAASQVTVQPLTAAETTWLLKMREEEKLARDVYEFLYGKWQARVFQNIAVSEQRHFEAIGNLLTRYGVSDPANSEPGKFTDTSLQTLYIQLTGSGDDSLKAALDAGVAIEEKDIADLEAALAATRKLDLKRVYVNLLQGSLNHLGAFERNLQAAAQTP